MSVFSLQRRMSPQHAGHAYIQQRDVRAARFVEGVQHLKGGGIHRRLDAVLTVRVRVGPQILRDALPVPGIIVAYSDLQHRPPPPRLF